jgi:hypothetical protein
MDESEVRFPVSCPLCAQELLTQMPMTVIARALSVGAAIHLRATCHDVHWEASALEVEQIRQYFEVVAGRIELTPVESVGAA